MNLKIIMTRKNLKWDDIKHIYLLYLDGNSFESIADTCKGLSKRNIQGIIKEYQDMINPLKSPVTRMRTVLNNNKMKIASKYIESIDKAIKLLENSINQIDLEFIEKCKVAGLY